MGIKLGAIKNLVKPRAERTEERSEKEHEANEGKTELRRVNFVDRLDELDYRMETLAKMGKKSIIPLSIKAFVQLAKETAFQKESVIFAVTRIQQLEQEEQEETGDGGSKIRRLLRRFARWIGKKLVKRAVKFLLKRVAKPILRFAVRFLAQAVRFVVMGVIRTIIVPAITAVVSFIAANPLIALVGTVLIGVGGFSYWAYNKFFNKDTGPVKTEKPVVPGVLKSIFAKMRGKEVTDLSYLPQGIYPSEMPLGGGVTIPAQVTPAQVKSGIALMKKRTPTVANAIAYSSQLVGVQESTLTAFAAVESSFNPNAGASTSSAKGLFQFTRDTWRNMLAAYGKRYGIPQDADIFDPVANAVMGAAYLKHEVAPQISKAVSNPSAVDFYFGHFLGPAGGRNFLLGLQKNPNAPAYTLVGANQARANQWVFYDKATGRAYTAQEVYNRFASKFAPIEAAFTGVTQTSALESKLAESDKTKSKAQESVVYKPGVSKESKLELPPVQTNKMSEKTSTGSPIVPNWDVIRGKNGKLYALVDEPL